MLPTLIAVVALLQVVSIGVLVFMLRRRPPAVDLSPLVARLESAERSQERLERGFRDDFARQRTESTAAAQQLRDEMRQQLASIRSTVEEQLQGTLERRLGESFSLVSSQLEQVHKGLGEMQTLAAGVGDLKRVLTNVKIRGTWGEVQLGSLLEQILTPAQYAQNVCTKGEGGERVEYAIRLPGRDATGAEQVWLPIDAKFPQEDYARLCEASERGDVAAMDAASKQLDIRVRQCARDICDKYIAPPRTTDFGIMFLPTEGLYAEVIRRPGLADSIQRDLRVAVAGPTTLAALLNSLQMGFRTLAIEKRSSEVWTVLGDAKTEFRRYGDVLDKIKTKLQEATSVVDKAGVRTRAIERKLRGVEETPAAAILEANPLPLPSEPS
jgi:DNA recombination protein RmuC